MVIMANMQMEMRKDGGYYCDYGLDRGLLMESTPPSRCYSINSSSVALQRCSFSSGGGRSSVGGSGSVGLGYIEHTVTKYDTLAGVAIKYGVEVADIKRMNGLTTDLQMFARKSLQIPLPGRHPPSPIISHRRTNSETPPVSDKRSELPSPIRSLRLSSSSSPQTHSNHNPNGETFEEAPKPPLGTHRKSKSLFVNNGLSEKLVRRRKSEVDLNNHSPEMAPKQDNNDDNSSSTKKGLGLESLFPLGLMAETLSRVRKSSSTPSFQDSSSSSSSIWPTSMLNLTADLQAAITLPIFDGLPNPIATPKKD